jgi:hypothetical protein
MSRQRQILNIMEEIFHEEKARMDPNEGLSYIIVKKKIIDGGVEENEFDSIKKLLQLNLRRNDLELQMGVFEKDLRRQMRIMDNAIDIEYKRIVEKKITDTRLKNKKFGGPVGVETGGKDENPFEGAYDLVKEEMKPSTNPWLTKGMEVKEGRGKSRRKRKRKRKRTRRKRRKRTKNKRRKGAGTRRTRRRKTRRKSRRKKRKTRRKSKTKRKRRTRRRRR